MSSEYLWTLYMLMLFLQSVHIFEEIAMKGYEIAGSLNKYLVAASVLVFIANLALALMLMGKHAGYVLGLFSAVIAAGNGIVHPIAYLKFRSRKPAAGAGVFSSIPLGIAGCLVLIQIVPYVF